MSTTTSLLCQQCTVGTVRSFHQNVYSNREWKPRKRMNWSPSSAMLRCQRKDHKWRSSIWRYQSRRSSLFIRCASSTTGTEEKEPTIEELLTEIEQGTDKATPRQRPLTRTTRTYSVQNEELVADKVLTGRVKSIMTFGAFIDLGARIDGLLHISKLGEGFIKSVEDVLTVGQEVQVQIMEVDLPNRRVKLKMYNPIPKAEPAKSPFGSAPGGGREAFRGKIAGRGGPQVRRTETPKSNYQKGQAATGVVKNLTRRGCFVELPGGEEGFLHANEISAGGENSPIESLVQTGQEVKVKVLRIVDGRLNLTMKEEVDLKKLNEESNEHIFATNAFELAFRKNSIIRQYLEESGKLATLEPEDAKSKKKEAGVAKEETVEQTEEEKVPTAESEQSEKVEEEDEGKSPVVEKEEDLGADKVPEAKVTEEKALEKDKSPVALEEEELVEHKVPEAKKILDKEEEKAPSADVKQEPEQSEKVQDEVEDKSPVVEKEEEVIKDRVPEAKVTEAEEEVLEKEEETTAIPVVEKAVEDKAPEAKVTEAEEKILEKEEEKAPSAEVEQGIEHSEEVQEEVEDKSPVVEKEDEVVEDKVPEAKATESEEKVLEKEKNKEQEAEQSEDVDEEVQGNSPVKEEEVVENKVPEAKATEVGEKVPEKVEVEAENLEKPEENIAEKVVKAPMAEAEKVEQEAEKSENVEKDDEDDKSPVFVEDKLASAVKAFTETFASTPTASGKKPSAFEENNLEKEEKAGTAEAEKVDQEEEKPSALEENKRAAAEKEVDKTTDVPENLSSAEELKAPESIVEKEKAEDEEKPVIAETQDSIAVPDTKEKEEAIEESKKVDEIQEEAPASQEPEAIKGTNEAEAGTFEKNKASAISAALVKQLREQSGAGMMDCKKALVETNGNFEKAIEYLRKKGLAGADKKASRIAAEGLVGSYIHDGRIGVLLEVNSETDFVSRGEIFTQLVEDLGMQVAASQQVEYVSVEDVPTEFRNKEFEIEMQREDLQSKPEAIRAKIVEGRITKRLGDLALLEQPFIKNDSVLVKDLVKQTIASVGEKVQVRRFTRYVLGEGLEKRTHDLAAEVAAQTKVQEKAQEQVAAETPIEKTDQPVKATTDEDGSSVAISAALVKQLREETGTGMMDCKKALVETKGNFEQAKEYLRKKGLASAEKKVGRIAAEGLIVSYVHTGRIGVLMEVNCETDFVARNDVFKELAGDLAMQVVANPLVDYVSVDDVPAEVKEKERGIEMQREDLQNKPEQIRGKIVEGRLTKLLAERALLEQPFLKDDSILVKDMLKKTTATLGENIQVRRFVRYTLGEGIEKKSQNFAEEVAAQVKAV